LGFGFAAFEVSEDEAQRGDKFGLDTAKRGRGVIGQRCDMFSQMRSECKAARAEPAKQPDAFMAGRGERGHGTMLEACKLAKRVFMVWRAASKRKFVWRGRANAGAGGERAFRGVIWRGERGQGGVICGAGGAGGVRGGALRFFKGCAPEAGPAQGEGIMPRGDGACVFVCMLTCFNLTEPWGERKPVCFRKAGNAHAIGKDNGVESLAVDLARLQVYLYRLAKLERCAVQKRVRLAYLLGEADH